MNFTRRKNIFRNIRSNLNRFLSIMFIVALGAGFMAGLSSASPDMYESADRYMDAYRLFDIHIKSLTGFTRDTTEQIEAMEEVETLSGGRVYDMVLDQGGESEFTSRVYGILDENGETTLNQFRLIEGRLPEQPGECVVESVFGRYSDAAIRIGEELSLSENSSNYALMTRVMEDTKLRIVGICQSPMCISLEGDTTNIGAGTINLNVYTRKDLFTSEADTDTDLFLRVTGAGEKNTFHDDYRSLVNNVTDKLRALGDSLSENAPLQPGNQELSKQISDARELLGLIHSLTDIQMQMKSETDKDLQATRDVLQQLPDGALKERLEVTASAMEEGNPPEASSEGLARSLENAITQEEELLDLVQTGMWIFRTREDVASISSYSDNVGKVSALAGIFPVFFFVVALLVALTTMTRLVEENRLQIGTLKALGYTNGQILAEYVLFSMLASVFGCIIGFGAGFYIFPTAINNAYSMLYSLPAMQTPVRWDIVAYVAPVTILSILIACLWSCWNEFRSVPARLMTPRAPAAGKRIWLERIHPVWKRLTFTYKVTFRNLFRYKKRFVMTIIGVAGCTALLVTGFGLRDSVNDIVDRQFGEIYRYDMLFSALTPEFLEKDRNLQAIMSDPEQIQNHLLVCMENMHIYAGTEKEQLQILVPEDEAAFPEFITLRSRKSQMPYPLTDDGVILTEKLCEEMHIRKGDTVILEDEEGHQAEAVVSEITEHYISNFAYMTRDCYESLFHEAPAFTGLLCISAGSQTDVSGLAAEILSSPYILYGRSIEGLMETFSDSIQSINGVIFILIIAAGLLSMVVLYNLINVNICERRKELATLLVLGFYPNEMRSYIFRETNILSFLGSLAGLVIGVWLHSFVVRTVEVNQVMFGRDISIVSYLLALLISVGFTLIVNLIMRRPIGKTDMVEAMKAND